MKHKLCRVCLSEENLQSLYANEKILFMLQSFTHLQYEKIKKLSRKICSTCIETITFAFNFSNQCLAIAEEYNKIVSLYYKYEQFDHLQLEMLKENIRNCFHLKKICRICLSDENLQLFDVEIIHMLQLCTRLELINDKYLSKKVCTHCSNKIKYVYDFYTMCHTNAIKLEKLLMKEEDMEENSDLNISSSSLTNYIQDLCNATLQEGSEIFEVTVTEDNKFDKKSFFEMEKLLDAEESILTESLKIHIKQEIKEEIEKNVTTIIKENEGESLEDDAIIKDSASEMLDTLQEIESIKTESTLSQTTDDSEKLTDLSNSMPENVKKLHSCSFCSKSYKKKYDLKRHMLLHDDENPYVCTTCGKKFGRSDELNRHIITHRDIKPYVCEECGKSFKELSNMIKHRNKHLKIKPFMCNVCGKCFSFQSNLNTHKLQHEVKKMHACDICGKVFTHKGNLVQHQIVHSNARPFKCEICGKTFPRSSALKKHLKMHERLANKENSK